MKNLLLILIILIFNKCGTIHQGDINEMPVKIKYNNNIYTITKIYINVNSESTDWVYFVTPENDSIPIPEVINFNKNNGKTTQTKSIVIIK